MVSVGGHLICCCKRRPKSQNSPEVASVSDFIHTQKSVSGASNIMSTQLLHRTAAAVGKAKSPRDNATATQLNVAAIAEMEREATACRSVGERMGDAIARHAGRLWFISAHAIWFGGWILLNAGLIRRVHPFDPFPYQFLTFVVSLEAIFLSLFILMSQNRAGKQADSRSHLDLQINLLAEQESTKMLQMLQKLCEYHNLTIADDPEVELLKGPTQPEILLKELKETLPENC